MAGGLAAKLELDCFGVKMNPVVVLPSFSFLVFLLPPERNLKYYIDSSASLQEVLYCETLGYHLFWIPDA